MIFVTGANGFLGRHVVRALTASGRPVRALLSRPDPDFARLFPDVEGVACDLVDGAALPAALAGVDTVVHLASKNVDRDGSGFERVNVEGTRRLAALAVAAGVERLIYVSSVGVYGHGAHRGSDETTPVRPDTPFSRSKAAAEAIVLGYHRAGDLRGVVLRHRFVYGEGDAAVLPRLIKAARSYPFWISGGRAKMSLVWAPDFAAVVERMVAGAGDDAGEGGGEGPVFHVTDGRPISYREVITTLCNSFGYRPPRFSVPFWLLYAPVRLRELLLGIDPETAAASVTSIRLKLVAQDSYYSRRKLEQLLGELDCAPFADGLAASRDYYAQFG